MVIALASAVLHPHSAVGISSPASAALLLLSSVVAALYLGSLNRGDLVARLKRLFRSVTPGTSAAYEPRL
jgi:hypothetical protein